VSTLKFVGTRFALSLLLLLAFALRIHLLGAQSLWNDEGNAYVQATRTFTDIAANAARDIHPPGYYWLLAGWRLLAGETEFALRALSAFASVLTVAFTFALGRRLFGGIGGGSAALFVALNTFSIYYAQEARMYALLALLGVASMWAFVRLFEPRRKRIESRRDGENGEHGGKIILLALINAAGLYTQYAFIYVLLAQGILVALWVLGSVFSVHRAKQSSGIPHPSQPRTENRELRTLFAYILANLLTLLLFLPWLPTAWVQVTTWPRTGQDAPLLESLSVILNWLIYGITSQNASLAVAWLLVLFGVWRGRRGGALLPFVWVVVSIGMFLAQGLFREENLKFILPAQVGMALWMGRGAAVLWDGVRDDARRVWANRITRLAGVGAAAFVTLTMAQGIAPLYGDPAYQRADYRTIAALAEAELGADDAIILNAPNQAEVFNYYYRGAAQVYGLPAGLGGDDAVTAAAMDDVIAAAGRVYAVYWGDRDRDPQRIVEQTLDSQTFSGGDTWFGDVRLARYQTALDMDTFSDSAVSATLGDSLRLQSVQYTPVISAGDWLRVALEWTTDAPISQRYKVFVQLLNANGVLVTQHDDEPGGGLALTTTWQPDTSVRDLHALILPTNMPPGTYTLIAGMYALDPPYARLPVDGGDYVRLGEVEIK
jgi:mannosyltransferase